MMLVDMKGILSGMEEKHTAVGSFNAPNLETVLGVVEAAERVGCPVILMHAQVHEALIPLETIAPILLHAAKQAAVPVCVHLDHGETLEYIQKAIDLGFTSVMYDGSRLPYEENLARTKKVAGVAHAAGVSLEAELGVIARDTEEPIGRCTDPEAAAAFAEAVPLEALACAFGTAHGIYKDPPKLDFLRLEDIHAKTTVPLVMHGGSGISFDDYRHAIQCGIRKINYYTYMAKAAGEAVRECLAKTEGVAYYHEVVSWGRTAISAHVEKVLRAFNEKAEQ